MRAQDRTLTCDPCETSRLAIAAGGFALLTRARLWFVFDASESQQELSRVHGATASGFAASARVHERTTAVLPEGPGCCTNLGRIFRQTLPCDERPLGRPNSDNSTLIEDIVYNASNLPDQWVCAVFIMADGGPHSLRHRASFFDACLAGVSALW